MSTKPSWRERFKSGRSKNAGKPVEQNGRHQPLVVSGPSACHAETLIAHNPSITPFVDGEDCTKFTPSNVTNLPVTIDAQGTPASPDRGAKKDRLPASAVQEPQLAIEFAVQQTQAISTSQRLWNDAYDSLENDIETTELAKAYLKTLTVALKPEKAPDTSASRASDISTELKDPTKRQMHMKKLLEDGQAKIFKASNITKGVGDVAQFILAAKGLVDSAIQSIPQAALPWAGICVGLQILLNPANATRSNLAGIVHVVSRMDWYCGLTEHLLNKDNIEFGNTSFTTVLQQLEKRVVTLYKALLLYQMKSVCSYYRNQSLVFLRSLVNLDNWDSDLKSVTDAEVTLQNDSDQYNRQHAKSSLGQLVECAKTMETGLGDVLQAVRDTIALQNAKQDDKCLQDLYVVDPQDDIKAIQKKKDTLLDDAYKWILQNDQYKAFTNWSNETAPSLACSLLWVKGSAGRGKTMLLIGIIRELLDQSAVLAPSVSHFFCQGTDNKAKNNATAILRSLVWMLLIQQPHLIDHLKSEYDQKGGLLFSDGNAFFAMSRLFQNMLKDIRLSRVYFIVDALDECDQGLAGLIQLISTSLKLSDRVKWLVSSRPEVDVLGRLKDLDRENPDPVGILLELDDGSQKGPVNAYIIHKLSNLEGRDGYDEDTLTKVSNEIRQREEKTFLWVALVFKELDVEDESLNLVHGSYALETIKDIPSGLSKLYDHLMTRIEKGAKRDPKYCRDVLVATVLARRPLSLPELAVLAGLPLTLPRTIVRKCGSFLTIKKDIVYLIHQSAKDYLEANHNLELQPNRAVQGHADISSRSIDAMSKGLKRNIYTLSHVCSQSEDVEVPNPDPLEGLRYCCIYWVQHLQKSSSQLRDDDQVDQFLQVHLLHWLEALGWMRMTSEGILAISSLETLILAKESPNLHSFVYDAKRFALYNRLVIEQTPLQLYCSGLVFVPEKSIVRVKFEKDIPTWIQRKPKVQANWSAALQTLEGHSGWVLSAAFSPDGQRIVSGSGDRTVRLWDAVTGALLQTLEGHSDSVLSAAFSPDGQRIVSGSGDRTVRLWDAVTGALLQTLEGHSGWVNSAAFSPDGQRIVSGSDDSTVRLWDAVTGALLQTLEGHSGSVNSAAFSPDGQRIVSGSGDSTVRLWDAVTGALLQTLEGHSGSVWSAAFSPDGQRIVSGSNDRTVRLWDAVTGALLQTLEGHSGSVRSAAFSPDGQRIVSGSNDRTVRLWDAVTGALLQTLEGHSGSVLSAAFSPDGQRIVSGSGDSTVRLWDAVTGALLQTLEGHSGSVLSAAFSPDGQRIVSGSGDSTVRLWDAVTGALLQTLEGHSGSVWSAAFSPDGQRIVSGSDDSTVRLWDAVTGALLQTLEGHSDWVRSAAFSPDGQRIVSGSDDRIVRLWDAVTGAPLQTLEGHSGWVLSAAFSPDGQRIVSGSGDSTVRLWDAVTGALLQTLEGHSGSVLSAAFSPDGQRIVSGSGDRTVRLWDAVTGALLQTLEGHSGSVLSAAFSPDGQQVNPLLVSDNWVVEGKKKILWLPPDYRLPTCIAVWNKTIVLGYSSGRVSILGFQEGLKVL